MRETMVLTEAARLSATPCREKLVEGANAAVTFAAASASLSAIQFGLSAQSSGACMIDDGLLVIDWESKFRMPASRLVINKRTPALLPQQLRHLFASHCYGRGTICSFDQLLVLHDEISIMAGVGRATMQAIQSSDNRLTLALKQRVVDMLDVCVLLTSTVRISRELSRMRKALIAVQLTGDCGELRLHWIGKVFDRFAWETRGEDVLPILDRIVPLQEKMPANDRMRGRRRLVELLHDR